MGPIGLKGPVKTSKTVVY